MWLHPQHTTAHVNVTRLYSVACKERSVVHGCMAGCDEAVKTSVAQRDQNCVRK